MRSAMVLVAFSGLAVVGCASDPAPHLCRVVETADAGDLAAFKAQRCNVSGSMGASHWYRLSATLPDDQIVQLELWDNRGPFAGDAVTPGTFPITGKELSVASCGVCLRAVADKGTDMERQFFATGGMVEVSAVGPDADVPFVATITGVTFAEVTADFSPVADGCTASLARVKVSGTVMIMGGGGGGGGGAGGSGAAGCVTTVGD